VNDHKAVHVRAQVAEAARAMPGAPITCFGLAFKPDVADLRESPALEIALGLAAEFPGRVVAVEPHVAAVPGLELLGLEAGLERAGIFVLLVDHAAFRAVGRERLVGRFVVDTRGVWRGGGV
jgi:UDP-N-acetyl-D-mannosaminuronic acid dehydrogenase